jgi:iron-sulfur cluster repair protein YtfE (RIC family)
MSYTPSTALAELMQQHARLRDMMERCEELADEADRTGDAPVNLTREVAKLRIAFDAHNQFEEEMLRPVLLAQDAFGAVRIERMVEQHIGEHRAIRTRLHGWVTDQLREVIADLRAHLEAEERYFLSSRVLRDDVVTLEGAG